MTCFAMVVCNDLFLRCLLQDDERRPGEAALPPLHLEHEDDLVSRPERDHAGDTQGPGQKQL